MLEYLTEEDYEIASRNGISRSTAYQRVYTSNWTVQRAITEPSKKISRWSQYKDLCSANGINRGTFDSRIAKGMLPEEAATRKVTPNGTSAKRGRVIPLEYLDLAESNGICKTTLYQRRFTLHWSWEKAATQPIATKFRRKNGY